MLGLADCAFPAIDAAGVLDARAYRLAAHGIDLLRGRPSDPLRCFPVGRDGLGNIVWWGGLRVGGVDRRQGTVRFLSFFYLISGL